MITFHNEWSPVLKKGHIGFSPKHCTINHSCSLHTFIDKHLQHTHTQKKNLSPLCRWEETFDSIWHKKLFYGLYDIIQSIYTQNKCRIPISDKHSQISSARSESKSNANPDSDKSDNQGLLALKQIFTENVMKHINNYLK